VSMSPRSRPIPTDPVWPLPPCRRRAPPCRAGCHRPEQNQSASTTRSGKERVSVRSMFRHRHPIPTHHSLVGDRYAPPSRPPYRACCRRPCGGRSAHSDHTPESGWSIFRSPHHTPIVRWRRHYWCILQKEPPCRGRCHRPSHVLPVRKARCRRWQIRSKPAPPFGSREER